MTWRITSSQDEQANKSKPQGCRLSASRLMTQSNPILEQSITMTDYVYDCLVPPANPSEGTGASASTRDIRVLDILPGANDDEICCELRRVKSGDKAEYEALSYTWGAPDRTHRIRCRTAFLRVTVTLREALQTLRDPRKRRTMWIDQLCINQENKSERSDQVKIMHLIYKHAVRAVIFLGSGQDRTSLTAADLNIWRLIKDILRAHKKEASSTLAEFQHLYAHPWFQRVWILQEVGMSETKNVIIYYRGSVLSWQTIVQAATFLGSYEPGERYQAVQLPPSPRRHEMIMSKWTTMGTSASPFPTINRYGHLRDHNNFYQSHFLWDVSLTELLQDSRFCLATDPRDKVYSLLNMLGTQGIYPKLAWLLEIDYSLPPVQVYARAARYSIETECSLEIMCYKEGAAAIDSLPSWVPDWTRQQLFPIHRISMPWHYRSQFHAAIPMAMYTLPRQKLRNFDSVAQFSNNGKGITLTGYKLDLVAHTSSIWKAALENDDRATFAEWADVFTGDQGSEMTDLPFKAESRLKGIKTAPYSICDFWLRVSRSPRFKTNDTLSPFNSDHPAQEKWKRSVYRRHRWRSRTTIMLRNGLMSFTLFYSWLALMMPYASVGRRAAATKDGFFLLVPPETKPDDQVYFLKGGGTLGYVFRRKGETETLQFVGVAYVHGFFGCHMKWEGHVAETLHVD